MNSFYSLYRYIKLFIWLLPFLFFIGGFYCASQFAHNTSIQVPSIEGICLEKALADLSRLGLGLRLIDQREDGGLPERTVIFQVPRAGSFVRKNQDIFVAITKHPPEQLVPTFYHRFWQDIRGECAKQQHPVRGVWLKTHYPAKTCFAQLPLPDEPWNNVKMIVYLASQGRYLCIMPLLKGQRLADVRILLEKEGITIDICSVTFPLLDFNQDEAVIVDQKPAGGSLVDMKSLRYVQLQVDLM